LDKNLKLFFCNPNSSWEKGKIEKNHTTLREILPKGSSFDDFTQSNVNIIISINHADFQEIFLRVEKEQYFY